LTTSCLTYAAPFFGGWAGLGGMAMIPMVPMVMENDKVVPVMTQT